MTIIEKQNIVIIGASGHAKVVIDIVERENKYNIIGLIDSYKDMETLIFKHKILGTEDELPNLINKFNFKAGIIAIGDNWVRNLIYKKIVRLVPDFQFVSAIHPHAVIGKNIKIGQGTVIMPGVIVNSDSEIGDFCILNTKASLDHDGNIRKFSSLAPNVTVGGNVTIDSFTAICLGANIIQDVTIGKHSIVGAGALVNKNVGDYKMVYGVPIKVVRTIDKGEKYLYHVDNYAQQLNIINNAASLEVITGKTGWDSLLKKIDHYDFYHTYDYHELSKADNETPILIKYVENDIIIALPLLIRNISGTTYKDATSVYGYSGPISNGIPYNFDNSTYHSKLLDYFTQNNYVSIFSRLNPFISGQSRALINLGETIIKGKVVNINIQEDQEIQRQVFKSRLKTHINKARRCCSIKKAITKDDIQEFINIYYENMDRVNANKSYYFNTAYFHKIISSNNFESEILLAIDNETGQIIAGSQFITTKGIVQYHLSGAKSDFLHLMPTKLLIDEMRILASQRGSKFFNLGGGLGGADDDSLFHFKSSFSKDFKDFNLWKFIVNQEVYDELVSKKGIVNKSDYFPLYRSIDNLNINF